MGHSRAGGEEEEKGSVLMVVGILIMDSGVCHLHNFRGLLKENKIWFLGREKT